MRYVEARIIENTREKTYRIYVTDSLYAHGKGLGLVKRWAEIAFPDEIQKEPDKSADEIAQSIMLKAGLKFR